ncbi:hypothetical protein IEQ34_013700 [Dendrobium chrysotoxum]|uniref:Secreted protein n=1 Tax=Dendrobium chrysotoxum TaxID=161865 RepID=A0AAV7G9K4_DENCH|nr:hypothetical protein IEQ34_013700 [Dendrobium chrysotoxum]
MPPSSTSAMPLRITLSLLLLLLLLLPELKLENWNSSCCESAERSSELKDRKRKENVISIIKKNKLLLEWVRMVNVF